MNIWWITGDLTNFYSPKYFVVIYFSVQIDHVTENFHGSHATLEAQLIIVIELSKTEPELTFGVKL